MAIKIISEHKKRNGPKGYGYNYTPLKAGMKRVMVVLGGQTRHIDVRK
jgi:hypothetical protein